MLTVECDLLVDQIACGFHSEMFRIKQKIDGKPEDNVEIVEIIR